MQFRSLHSLARRTLAAGAGSALALTLFNAVQPTLAPRHQIGPGTIKDVPVTLVPTPTGAVDNAGPRSSGSATLPLRGAQPGTGSVKAASAAAAGAELLSAPVAVGKARFVGVSWPAPAVGPPANLAGKVWLRARTAAGWSGWRAVEPAADGPDADTAEYRRAERVYSDGQWLDAGTAEVQLRVDQPAPATAAPSGAAVPQTGVQAHLITPDMTATPGPRRRGPGWRRRPRRGRRLSAGRGGGRWSRCGGPGPTTARP